MPRVRRRAVSQRADWKRALVRFLRDQSKRLFLYRNYFAVRSGPNEAWLRDFANGEEWRVVVRRTE